MDISVLKVSISFIGKEVSWLSDYRFYFGWIIYMVGGMMCEVNCIEGDYFLKCG